MSNKEPARKKRNETNENDRFKDKTVRHPYSRTKVETTITGKSRTETHHSESVKIDNIIARFDRTGQLPQGLNRGPGQYLDVTKFSHKDPMELDHYMTELRGQHEENLQKLEEAKAEAPSAEAPTESIDDTTTEALPKEGA